jgi:hypothetical protein
MAGEFRGRCDLSAYRSLQPAAFRHREAPGIRARAALALLLFTGGTATAFAATPEPAPPPAPGPVITARDRLYLSRVGEAMVLSRATAGKIWPGWGLEKAPILIYESGRVAYLINHPSPPPDFVRQEVKIPLLGPIYARFGRDSRFNANTSIELGDIPTACIGYSTAPADVEGPSLRFVALLFHEAFHAFQTKNGRPGKGAVEALLQRYPDLNAENLALAQLEQIVLFQLLRFQDTPDPARIRGFLAIRNARLKAIGSEFLRAERGIEYQEGIPTYIEVRILEEARKAAAATPGLGAGDPYALGFSVSPELFTADYLARLLRFSADASSIRNRSYATGMAQALILDRLGVDWKTAVLTGEKYLDELLGEATPMSPESAASALAQAKKENGYDELLKGIQEGVARLGADRKQAGEAFLRQQGVQIAITPPAGPVELRGFDPMNIQRIDATRAIHKRLLRLAFGESTFSSTGVPVMVSLGEGPFDIRGATLFLPADELQVEIDFVAVPLEPGTRESRSSLRISGGGIVLQASVGTVVISPDRARIDVTLKR